MTLEKLEFKKASATTKLFLKGNKNYREIAHLDKERISGGAQQVTITELKEPFSNSIIASYCSINIAADPITPYIAFYRIKSLKALRFRLGFQTNGTAFEESSDGKNFTDCSKGFLDGFFNLLKREKPEEVFREFTLLLFTLMSSNQPDLKIVNSEKELREINGRIEENEFDFAKIQPLKFSQKDNAFFGEGFTYSEGQLFKFEIEVKKESFNLNLKAVAQISRQRGII
ncbi:MAG: hypothetical protein Q7R70_04585 [Candidatus Diapherotrites archaeon]|nr:hypothetical protein [Candidatus Diapherotrites archaeon]